MRRLNVLVACEESQAVCKAFRELGHEAYSCDLQECSGGHPEWHICDDVSKYLHDFNFFKTSDGIYHRVYSWDLIIAHPPCTYLSNAGARWLYQGGMLNEQRYENGLNAKRFFMQFMRTDCAHVAIENPIPSRVYELPKYDQIIEPYMFGDPYSKRTCLWLKGLPPLQSTNVIDRHIPYCSSGSYSRTHDPKYKGVSRSGGSAKIRSKTFPGIADAMAKQWSEYILQTDYGETR